MKKKLFIGIDVSKSWIDVTILHSSDVKKTDYQQFDNNSKTFASMTKWILASSKVEKDEILFCLEHTGVYSYSLCEYLSQNEYFTWV